MGSFNATCIVSGLPIEAGTPVRFLALTESAYHTGNEHICYVGGRWQIRTPPLRAKYNDYGSVEEIQPGLVEAVFFKGFDQDVIEKGVGDNQCHDVRVRVGMSPKEWLEALWEGRVFVGRQAKIDRDFDQKSKELRAQFPSKAVEEDEDRDSRPKGVPSLARIERVLTKAGLTLATDYGAPGYVVDQLVDGFIRIRAGRDYTTSEESLKDRFSELVTRLPHGEEILERLEEVVDRIRQTPLVEKALQRIPKKGDLEAILPLIQKAGFTAMITCGTGYYGNSKEMLVGPKPQIVKTSDDRGYNLTVLGFQRDPSEEKARGVTQAMIREDVWQILLRIKPETWGQGTYTIDRLREQGRKYIEEELAFEEKLNSKAVSTQFMRHLSDPPRDDVFRSSVQGMGVEGQAGYRLRDAMRLALEMRKDFSREELDAFVNDMAETIFAEWAYSTLHGQWHPTTNSGQDGNWEGHRAFLISLLGIKGRWEDEENEDEDEEDPEDDSEDEDEEPEDGEGGTPEEVSALDEE